MNERKTREDEVMNEKYCFVFYTKLRIGDETVTVRLANTKKFQQN